MIKQVEKGQERLDKSNMGWGARTLLWSKLAIIWESVQKPTGENIRQVTKYAIKKKKKQVYFETIGERIFYLSSISKIKLLASYGIHYCVSAKPEIQIQIQDGLILSTTSVT